MKLVDNRGKLFGFVNIIDLLFILILIVAIIAGASRLKNAPVLNEGSSEGTITFMVNDIRQVSVDNINVGDELYHYDKGVYLGVIEEVSVEPYKQRTDFEGQWVESAVPDRYTVYIKIKSDISETSESYIAGGEQMRVGIEYRVKSKGMAFFGTCVGIDLNN